MKKLLLILPFLSLVLARNVFSKLKHAVEDETDKFLETAMSADGVKEAFGDKSVQNAVTYDPEMEEYSGISKISNMNIQFVLFTRQNTDIDNGTEIYIGLKNHLLTYGFDPKAPTKIISHGFNSDYKHGPAGSLMPAYFNASTDAMNIIAVNWASMAGLHKVKPPEKPIIENNDTDNRQWTDIFYFPPARNTELVGNITGALVEFLVNSMGVDVKNVHLIGHSLGAHVMGYTGRFVQDVLGSSIARITGLDPAGPCFESFRFACFRGTFIPVSPNDAAFVDIIHTNAGRFGMRRTAGHADFYPNNGFKQPGCPGIWRPTSGSICAHVRSVKLMKDSILYPGSVFRSLQCPNWRDFADGQCSREDSPTAIMGEPCAPTTRGVFYLRTGSMDPFNVCAGGPYNIDVMQTFVLSLFSFISINI